MKKENDILKQEIADWLHDKGESPDAQLTNATETALIHWLEAHAMAPPVGVKDSIVSKLMQLTRQKKEQKTLDLAHLPLLDDQANWLEWQEAVAGIAPPDDYEDIHLHTLESNDQRELFVAWVKEFVPEEVHYDLIESFLLLEGSCECHITDRQGNTRIVRLGQGGFISMELGESHDIHITSSTPAKAILQWKKLAA